MSNTNDALREALEVLKDATSFMTKKSRDRHQKAVANLTAALSQSADAAQWWIPVDQQMPKSGQIVLALQKWGHSGKLGIIRAAWVAAKTEESSPESDIGEYDEATDTYYDPEGWYEQISHWDEISAAGVSGATIVAWMPLPDVTLAASPAAPQAEQPASQGEDGFVGVVIERDGMRGVFTVDVTFGGTPEIGASVYLTPQPDELMAQREEVTDAMVDAYLTEQRRTVEEADRQFGRPNIGGLHTNTVREACRNGLRAAITKVRVGSAL